MAKGEYGYSPGSKNDFETIAGHIFLDPNASWSAMLHEAQHFFDDYENGYPNYGFYFDGNGLEFWRMEFRGYLVELNFARKNRDFDLARKIIEEMRERRKQLRGF